MALGCGLARYHSNCSVSSGEKIIAVCSWWLRAARLMDRALVM